MQQLTYDESWPQSWRDSYRFDLEEVFDRVTNLGFAYAYEVRRKRALDLLTEGLPAGAKVLDIAAAQGNFTLPLAQRGYRVTWNDLRDDLIGYVQLKAGGELPIEFRPGDIFKAEFDQAFDAVLMTEVIEHVAHPDEFLARAASFLKPGGVLVMTTPNGKYFINKLPKFSECPDPSVYEAMQFKPDSDGHIFLLHPEEVAPLARAAGLVVDKLEVSTNFLTQGHIKTHKILPYLPKRLVMGLEQLSRELPEGLRQKVMAQMCVRMKKV